MIFLPDGKSETEPSGRTLAQKAQKDPNGNTKSVPGNLQKVNESKKEEAISFIVSTFDELIQKSKGINYSVNLNLKNDIKNGKEKSIEIKIQDTNENVKLLYKAPGNWLFAQFQLNLYLSIYSCLVATYSSYFSTSGKV